MELPAIDPSEAYIPHPMEDPGDKRPPEEARLATIAGGYEMDDSVILSSSFPQVPGYEEAVIGKQAAGPSAGGGASEAAPAAALPALPAKRKRGRPPKNPGGTAKQPAATAKRREEEESVCFVCLDGGTLVVCDRRGCLKAYHPACIGRDEAFFRSRSRWNCGWHMCSVCGKAASFMCYTCPYSLCKGCIRGTDFFCIRGNKGLCVSCYRLVSLLEKDGQANGEKVEVNFNDENSWEYLFKIYWLVLKGKLSLTIKELDDARRLWKVPGISAHKEASSDELYNADEQDASSDSSTGRHKAKVSSRRRNRKNAGKSADIKSPIHSEDNKQEGEFFPEEVWASQELLDFVAHMRHGNKSLLTQFDVQNLLLEYIKQNNLRNPRRRSQILCDARLEKLFGKDRVGHFEMLKLLELHFVVKETSEVEVEDKQEGPLDNHMDLMDVEELKSRELHNDTDKRHKNRKRVEEKGLLNVNDFAAIDAHNINLIYLRRSLMEQMIDDNNAFADNMVGFFVRIRIPGAGQKQDVYRLVQIVGTQKVAEKYKVGKKTTDIKLEILNLDRTETVAIDTISNQDFTEEECRRLRQSIKCGFINRLTVGNVQNKARILQAVRVTDWLENEKLRLSHLRDRASETGRRKELRECVEKLELLSKPEERMRRLNEVPEIHADPHMDPNYESPEEETHEKQGGRLRDMSGMKRKELFFPSRVSGDILSGALKTSSPSWTSNKTSSTEESQGKFEALIDAGEKITEALWNSNHDKNFSRASSRETPKVHAVLTNTIPNLQSGKQLALKPGEPDGVARPLSSVISVLSRAHDNDMIWHYQDPAGKIQGPFSMLQLRKWDSTGYFPPDLKIWLTSQKQEDAIQLTDALSVIQKATQQEQGSNFPRATNFVGSEVSTENKIYSGCKVDSSITSVKNPSDFTMLASSQNVGNNPAQMNQSTDLGTQKEVLDSCSRDTQYKLAKGNMGREVVSSLNATSLRDSVTNKNQFFESSCPSPTPGSEMKGLSPVHTNEVGPCQMMTKVSEAYAVQSQERDPAPPSVDRDGNLLNCSSSRQHADSDEIQFVLAQKAEYASVPKILSPSQEQLAVSVEENLLDDYEILDGISVINLEQHRNDDPEPSFLEPGHLESAELEGAEDIKSIEWSLPSPTPAPQPSSEWVLSPSLAQRGNPSNTLPPPIEADTSRQGRNVSLEWETPVTGTISASIDSGEGKQLNGSMKAGCGWGSSSQGDRSGSSPGWGEQSLGSMSANGGWGSPNSGRKTNGDSGWGAQSQSSMNTSGGRASTIESKSDANSAWRSDVQGNNNWGLPTWEKEETNCGWRSPGARHANENSGWATPTRSANTNANEGSVTARGSNVNCNDARSYGNDGHREGNQSKHGSDWNLRYKACSGGSGGNGSSSRGTLKGVQGQRGVCKFYESGYCKKGSSCKYLHS